ncbi:MAG: hypothetical protein PHS62_02665 [Patescibacteria group bacterium]|nr:hypothetical protein [Patescibacteria group bacterium]
MRILYIFFILLVLSVLVIQAGSVLASSSFDNGLKNAGETGMGYAAVTNPGNFLVKLLGSFLTPMMMGVIATIIILYGGFTWMMARGNEEQVEKAKTIIINTLIAIVVVFSAFAISKLIIPLWEFVAK